MRGDFAFNVNGSREDANNFLLDGVYNVDPKLNTFGVKPPVDAIREFEVLTSAYDASFGRSAGAQVNIVLKSGTNGFHGTAYEFLRNQVARRAQLLRSGRPARPEKSAQPVRLFLRRPNRQRPHILLRRLRRRALPRRHHAAGQRADGARARGRFLAEPFRRRRSFPGPVPFPRRSDSAADFSTRSASRIAALYPLPNRNVPGLNFASSPIQRDRNDLFDVRIDHTFSAATQFSARYSFADRTLFEPFSGVTQVFVPGYGNNVLRRGQNADARRDSRLFAATRSTTRAWPSTA